MPAIGQGGRRAAPAKPLHRLGHRRNTGRPGPHRRQPRLVQAGVAVARSKGPQTHASGARGFVSESTLPPAFITYGWCRSAYTVARSLARRGVEVHVGDSSALAMARFSRHVRSFTRLPDFFHSPRSTSKPLRRPCGAPARRSYFPVSRTSSWSSDIVRCSRPTPKSRSLTWTTGRLPKTSWTMPSAYPPPAARAGNLAR